MIKELRPNYEDDYSWHEVNCFFRAWSIVLQSYHKSYFNNFLQTMFLNWTFFPESIAPSENDDFMLDSNENVLSPLFNVRAEKIYYQDEQQFHSLIQERIREKHRLIIPGNIFNIYYNAAYRTKHNEHYFIIRGIDEQNRRYYILDNLHLENGSSTLYDDFLILWDTLYESNQLFFAQFQPTSEPYFWAVSQQSPEHTDNTKLIFETNLHVLNQYIDSYRDSKLEQMIMGIDNKSDQIKQFFMKYNHKNTYFKILRHVFKPLELDTSRFEQLIESFQQLKAKIPISLAGSDSSSAIFQQYSELEKGLLLEMRDLIHLYLEKTLNTPTDRTAKSASNSKNSIILNDQNVELYFNHEEVRVTHTPLHKTDTWISENEAFQMLWAPDGGHDECDLLEVSIENANEPGLPFQSGIIVTYENEYVLFGPLQNLSLSLFVPQRRSEYCVREIQYMHRTVQLMVRRKPDQGLLFYYKIPGDSDYRLFSEEALPPNFSSIGLFSRTWEHIHHTTVFTDLTVYNNNSNLKGRDEHERNGIEIA